MKKVFFLSLVMLPAFAFAQTDSLSSNPTSEAEYNWVTKSYMDVLTKGADIKRDYKIKSLYKADVGKRDIELQGFYDEKTDKRKATIIIFFRNSEPVKILCMPNKGSGKVIFTKYFEDVAGLWTAQATNLIAVLTKYYVEHYEDK